MEEQLITFETAKLAKEKGFNITVPQGYDSNELEYQNLMEATTVPVPVKEIITRQVGEF